jgi:1-deoxy-D-xylulose-5-phosphate synthase
MAYLRCIPNLTIAAPRNAKVLQDLIYTAQLGLDQPLAIRYPRGYSQLDELSFNFEKTEWGKGEQLKTGSRFALLSIGTLAQTISESLTKLANSKWFAHFDLGFVKPLDAEMLHGIFKNYERIIVFEEGTVKGGVGSAVLEFGALHQYSTPVDLEGVPDEFVTHGTTQKLLENLGLDVHGICKKLNSVSNKNKE